MALARESGSIMAAPEDTGALEIVSQSGALPVWVDDADWKGVLRAAGDLAADAERVTGVKPVLSTASDAPGKTLVIVGTLGKSEMVDKIAADGKIDGKALEGRWESFLLQVVDNPLPGIDRALVIAGSDKRGTIYGIYTLSKAIGVSPWYWWADVPAAHRDSISVAGRLYDDGPAVKYRGIFINDEAPAFSGWAKEKFGGVNSKLYTHMFELILRLKGNYMWPAMWNNAFNEDDPLNPILADEYGVVMGTSHHEPMIRSQQEWKRHGSGDWNYEKNGEVLRQFWADGIRRNKDLESIVTMGMRGDGDEAMSEDTNTALLERIVADQRTILERETGKKASEIPQLWALYKEVQDYYEHGMRVPDDVTLLWCDDNWGNIRRLPLTEERKRSGGAGIYYHFDYVGGPRSYKWICTIPLTKIWEQMHLAYEYDATRIWIVNVGDLKPMEYPISFFIDYGWDPESIPYEKLGDYAKTWAAQQFGDAYAEEAAALITGYTQLNALRKPEMTAPGTYNVASYGEADAVLAAWNGLRDRAEALDSRIPAAMKDAFYELVYYPVVACANLNEMYISAAKNDFYAMQGRASANAMADKVRACFDTDWALALRYNRDIAEGRWSHTMDQKRIGWTYWQQPPLERAPAVSYVRPLDEGAIGVSLAGFPFAWPENDIFQPRTPPTPIRQGDCRGVSFEIFNRADQPVDWKASAMDAWTLLSEGNDRDQALSGMLEGAETVRLAVNIDWANVPADAKEAVVKVAGMGPEGPCTVTLRFPLLRRPDTTLPVVDGAAIAFEAAAFSRAVAGQSVTWQVLKDFGIGYGRNAVTTFPSVHERIQPAEDTPHLEYDVYFAKAGSCGIQLQVAPTLNFLSGDGIKVAISVDDGQPQVFVVGTKAGASREWDQAVSEGVRKLDSTHTIAAPGVHTIKVWFVDPGVVLRQLIVDTANARPSYLGPLGLSQLQ
ncbi:MAG TPA: glycosyl hydrolase 115 family protein [Opitutales bacterium]|nr:glycosyl hydrolase 115 family protein [Opitutales bacterium]